MARTINAEKLQERLIKSEEKIKDLQKRLEAAKAEKNEIEEQLRQMKINAIVDLLDKNEMSLDDLEKLINNR